MTWEERLDAGMRAAMNLAAAELEWAQWGRPGVPFDPVAAIWRAAHRRKRRRRRA